VRHEPASPTLLLQDVSVVYASSSNGNSNLEQHGFEAFRNALNSVNFQVDEGERIAIVGPNGAGKSTLLKLIAGTLKPSSGTVNVFGHEPDKHICIAYVPQRSQIDWSFPVTVEDVVMMGRVGQIGLFRWPRRRDRVIVQTSLNRVGIAHLSELQIGELSSGQQQRVFLARALAQRADLILLDEPFNGLDLPSHDAILEILDLLHQDGVTVIVSTHDLSLAEETFDRIMLLNKRVVALGSAKDVLTSQNLMQAYGSQVHVLNENENSLLVADACRDDGETVEVPENLRVGD
jgi:ABC-type Mn2+/Zn2+ transport system ATPase subunit